MVTSITLSTGTVVRIPVFPAIPEGSGRTKLSRANGVLRDYQCYPNVSYDVVYSAVTNAELLELINMISGTTCDTLVTPDSSVPTNSGHAIVFLLWKYNSINDNMTLQCSWYITGSTATLSHTNFGGLSDSPNFYNDHNYFNNENTHPFESPNFYDYLDETMLPNAEYAANVRSGTYYSIDAIITTDYTYILNTTAAYTESQVRTNIQSYIEDHPGEGIDYNEAPSDYENPYGIIISEGGGGDGAGEGADIDDITKMEVPDLPTIDINNCGFITTYAATIGQIKALANFLWSNAFDIDSFKKLFSDPMQCIIGLGIVPVQPVVTGSQTVHFGDIDSHVAMSTCAQYAQKDCGSVSIKPYIGSFLDYAPYVNISIYLPYVGIRELSPDDVMDDTVNVTYNIDVLTGGCAAIVSTSKKGVLYQFNGNCITNVPLTSINYSGAIQNAVSAVGSVATMGVGIATGVAPLTAMGATSLAANAANTACNSKPTVQRSGSMGGSAGMLSVQTPYLIINRPRLSVPDKLNKFTGNTCNITMTLNKCKGFTMVDYVHLNNIPAMEDEKKELMSILKQGVIF